MNSLPVITLLLLLPGSASAVEAPYQPRFRLSDFHAPLLIDNALLPMKAGTRVVFYEREDGECKVNDVVVTHAAKHDFRGAYAGIAARVVTDRVWSDPDCDGRRAALLEDTSDWYGQDDAGNVWYFGEATIEYFYDDAGHPTGSSTEGSWEAGRAGAKAGLAMLARPVVGRFYRQEFSAGIAEDAARVERVDIRANTGLGHFRHCVRTRETTALSPGDVEYKDYCPNIGLVRVIAPRVQGGAELVALALH